MNNAHTQNEKHNLEKFGITPLYCIIRLTAGKHKKKHRLHGMYVF